MKQLPSKNVSVNTFLEKVKQGAVTSWKPARLIFAMDATASREHSWDLATQLHAELFTTAQQKDLTVQLVYYRGIFDFHASTWNSKATELHETMQEVRCLGGRTQILRVLTHAYEESLRENVKALAFVGDACEEDPQELYSIAGRLGLIGVPVFLFQEGFESDTSAIFGEIARRTKGVHIPFTPGSAQAFAELLNTVAAYAAGGITAVNQLKGRFTTRLLEQLQS